MKTNISGKAAAFAAVFLLIFPSCEKLPEELPGDPVPINLTLKQASLVSSGNDFAFDIFRKMAETAGDENMIISPLSISYALSMTVNGAAAATRDSMFKALRISDISIDDLNNSYKDLASALLSVDKRVIMKIANSVWTENDFQVRKSFIDVLKAYYNAESESFEVTDPSAPDMMNKWIEDNTNGLIKDMIDNLDPAAVMLLINAVYFKAKWKYEFNASDTKNRNFTLIGGSSASLPTMNNTSARKLYDGNGFKLVELPYGQGNFVMDVLLPDEVGFSGLLPQLTSENFNGWIEAANTFDVDLYLPKFKYDYRKKLKDVLSYMGMGLAFSDFADFSNIADASLKINDVTHQAFIETNEEGTEAAAATVVEIVLTSVGPTPVIIDINRPFVYIIREITTNSVIFMGQVTNPLEE
jgi:serpin B